MEDNWKSAASSAAGAILGMATAKWQDKRQISQQEKLNKMQIAGQKEMGAYNQELALDMWDKTGYGAQRRQMEEAGLNVGLMYGGAGSGGTTQGGAAGNVSGGQAAAGSGEIGMAMQLGMQMSLMKAQKENIEADTDKKKAETPKAETEIAVGKEQAEKYKQEGVKAGFEAKMAEIDYRIKESTQETERLRLIAERDKTVAEADQAEADAWVASTTISERQRQMRLNNEATQVAIRAAEAGILKTNVDRKLAESNIQKVAADIRVSLANNQREWDKLSIAEREIYVKEAMQKNADAMTEFNTSTPQQIKQWTGILTDLVTLGGKK